MAVDMHINVTWMIDALSWGSIVGRLEGYFLF